MRVMGSCADVDRLLIQRFRMNLFESNDSNVINLDTMVVCRSSSIGIMPVGPPLLTVMTVPAHCTRHPENPKPYYGMCPGTTGGLLLMQSFPYTELKAYGNAISVLIHVNCELIIHEKQLVENLVQ